MRVHAFYIILLLVACGVIFYMFHQLDKAGQVITSKESIIKEQKAELTKRVNSEGKTVVEKPVAFADIESLEKAYPKLIGDLREKLGIKSKNLVGALQARLQALGSGRIEVKHDTVIVKMDGNESNSEVVGIVEVDDHYLRLNGTIHSDIIDYLDYNYSYNDTLLLAVDKKKSFFKGETLKISGMLQNPNAQIVQTTGVVVHQVKPKRFNISVGVYYDPFRKQFGPAVTAGYAFIRF